MPPSKSTFLKYGIGGLKVKEWENIYPANTIIKKKWKWIHA